jgi:hypothetical protein
MALGGVAPHLRPHAQQQQQQQQQQAEQAQASLQAAIAASQRVGELLLKSGDAELAAVRQQADGLLARFRCVRACVCVCVCVCVCACVCVCVCARARAPHDALFVRVFAFVQVKARRAVVARPHGRRRCCIH